MLAPASAQEPKTSVREAVALAGTVERIDRVSRLLTLKGDDTRTHSVYVPPDVTLFDELKTDVSTVSLSVTYTFL